MAKLLFLGSLISGSALLAFCAKPSTPPSSSASFPLSTATAQRSQATNVTKLYNDTCAKCHGENGQGGGAGTKTLNTKELFDQGVDKRFFDVIKNGTHGGEMEAYGNTMTDAEIWGLVVHIRELQAKSLRQQFGSPQPTNGVYSSQYHKFKLETVVDERKGLNVPWSLDWLPDGRALVTNRPGGMFIVNKGGGLGPEIQGVPTSVEIGQGGLMEVAVHPDYAKNGWIYLSVCDPKKDNPRAGLTKIVRGKLQGNQWTNTQTIWEAPQEFYSGAGIHYGGKIVFDGKGHLFFAVGERGGNMKAQALDNPYGKIYRLNEDGTVPSDNPYVGKSPFPGIWTLGHRNPQGLVQGLDGSLWDTEHGPRGGDELNLIQKGANYGWPVVAFSINYNDSPFVTPWPKPEQNITLPVFRWLPSCAASGLDVAKGVGFPKWKGDLLAGGLAGNNLDRIRVSNGKLVEREELLFGLGRIRDVCNAPDGSVWILLNGPDKIIRLVPVS